MWDEFVKKAFDAVLSQYGAFGAVFVLFVVYLHWSLDKLWAARLSDKDKEIERLVDERNKLQAIVLRKRLTSGGKDNVKSR